jgi:acetoin:2,6-dichlorophenolindophenol oxidoreductase subunit alpha
METGQLRRAYEFMLLSRRLDDKCEQLEASGHKVHHFHSSTGQEATCVGAALPLRRDDYMFYTHRGYGQLMAKGVPVEKIVNDMCFSADGTNRGFGGVMHVVDPEVGIVGRSGVFGSRFGLSAGLALSAKLRKNGRVALCFYGEAAASRGPLFEALNMATIWKLPVIFLAENNGFSIGARTSYLYAGGNMSDMWRGFPIPVKQIDGNDVSVVYDTISEAVDRARVGEGPSVIEAVTYRLAKHIPADRYDGIYRSKEEVMEAWKREPLAPTRQKLIAAGALTEKEDEQLDRAARERVEAAFKAAEGGPRADFSEVYSYVYWQKEVAP